ncbi:hypothetical protein CSOJ01_14843 [Colletotrichum sojae]|uniref:Ubiquitin 3 binding protein But2 C-terminal domain-containing protein n=1 Tax=Colletotrichum sojae TaxID=2175907 RepID=A0A8H6MJD0_9PEZI|nr:hypothetical protein CSOJ01_14843 [Colletotrichum sojae]
MFTKPLLAAALALTSALAAPLESRQSSASFGPSATFAYNVGTGRIDPLSNQGYVSKYYQNNGQDLTALLTFTYPEAARGRTCQFVFQSDPAKTWASGSQKLDLFTSLQPAPAGGATTWPPGNQRDQNIGRLSVANGAGQSTWDVTFGEKISKPVPCAAPGTVEAYELVGVYDNDYVSWRDGAGPRIVYW